MVLFFVGQQPLDSFGFPHDKSSFAHLISTMCFFPSQAPGIQVEFDIETEETGKLKCVNVTLPGGAPIQPSAFPRRPYRGDGGGGGDNAENAENTTPAEPKTTNNNRREKKENSNKDKESGQGTAAPKEKEIPFHKVIAADIKAGIETSSGLKLGENTTTVDISLNDARIKLGQGGYASMVLAEGLIAEGSYKCDAIGTVTFTWEHVMTCQGDAWVKGSTDGILSSFALTDGTQYGLFELLYSLAYMNHF